ncbi:hypothetical protein [Herpetosiphon llansteffanensis]|uniref:hypothetical protein n=1 Tax=Herpetosiphon llansteffanensis TaxID=2094568 RepID=UPI000D7C2C75|nr:hypothetical protein [Herpetosiphon llansteffanensis]
MDNASNQLKHDPRAISRYLFERSKLWFSISMTLKASILIVASIAIFTTNFFALVAPYTVYIFSICSELCIWRSDTIKGIADGLLRKLDMRDSLGWSLRAQDIRDIVIRLPKKIRESLPNERSGEQYFENNNPYGIEKTIANIQETSWWSKQIANSAWVFTLVISCILLIISIILLIVSIQLTLKSAILSNISRVVTATITSVFTSGLFKLTVSYYRFSQKSAQIENQAIHLMQNSSTEIQIVKLFHEYQVARATAPLLPSWIWKLRNQELTQMWHDYMDKKKI